MGSRLKEVPERVLDRGHSITYIRGKFLGKGGFARCYELTKSSTNEVFAGKIVSKTLLTRDYQRDKMVQEVQIHRYLNHPNVVRLFTCFEDDDNVYITLELCSRHSLMELHRRRKIVTEPEARYFLHHICLGLDYLHDRNIVHRDLKLGNLFINEQMVLKLGDFGLATKVEDGNPRRTLCGTPNYIAPEVLEKTGHSFEVDIWAIGCILYTLRFGKPPFETKTLKDTYQKIRKNEYEIPKYCCPTVHQLITRLLAADLKQRPTIKEVVLHSFFTSGYLPKRLPLSCLTMAPKFNNEDISDFNSPVRVRNNENSGRGILTPVQIARQNIMTQNGNNSSPAQQPNQNKENNESEVSDHPSDFYLSELYRQLQKVCASRITQRKFNRDADEAPECTPIFWVSKWMEYSQYGIGYELCDNSTGALFNDRTRLVLDDAGNELTYIEKNDKEHYHTIQKYPKELQKKVTILNYFREHMEEHLVKTGGHIAKKDGDDLARLPVLRNWFRTEKTAITLHLSNGTLQINYFRDHTKLIICPLMSAVTFIDQQQMFHVYEMSHLVKNGCPLALCNRLNYAKLMVEKLLTHEKPRTGGQ